MGRPNRDRHHLRDAPDRLRVDVRSGQADGNVDLELQSNANPNPDSDTDANRYHNPEADSQARTTGDASAVVLGPREWDRQRLILRRDRSPDWRGLHGANDWCAAAQQYRVDCTLERGRQRRQRALPGDVDEGRQAARQHRLAIKGHHGLAISIATGHRAAAGHPAVGDAVHAARLHQPVAADASRLSLRTTQLT